MRVAIVTFEGFNEIDSFTSFHILNRVKREGWRAEITAPNEHITSMNGITIYTQQPLSFANQADAVLFGSGKSTENIAHDRKLMSIFQLEPSRQLIGSQCSGALIMQSLGLLDDISVCADFSTRMLLAKRGANVIDKSFNSKGNLATAGGCLSSQYLAAWVIYQSLGRDAVIDALRFVVPIGEEESFIERVLKVLEQ